MLRITVMNGGVEILFSNDLLNAVFALNPKPLSFSSGPRKGREVYRHFGKAPGTPHAHTKYVYSSCEHRKTEQNVQVWVSKQIIVIH